MSQLLEFYRGQGTDAKGRRLEDTWAFSDDQMEWVHDFIQWLFPLPEPSAYNSTAPLLTSQDLTEFHHDSTLRANVQGSYQRFLAFLGLQRQDDGTVVEGPNFAARYPDVWASFNHNWLRITRVIRSLCLLYFLPEARALYNCLRGLQDNKDVPITDDTLRFWTAAVEGRSFPR